MIGIPTAISPAEAECLRRYAKGKRVVEAGALLGFSTITLARVATSVVSIDRHEGYGTPTLRRFLSNMERFGVHSKVKMVVGEASILASQYPADFAFIDLTGEYTLVRAVAMQCSAPIIAFHDVSRAYCTVGHVIEDLGLEVLTHVDTLAVCVNRHCSPASFAPATPPPS